LVDFHPSGTLELQSRLQYRLVEGYEAKHHADVLLHTLNQPVLHLEKLEKLDLPCTVY